METKILFVIWVGCMAYLATRIWDETHKEEK